MGTSHGKERREAKEEAFRRGHKDGTSGSLDGRSYYNDKPEERAAYVDGYLKGEKDVERWRRAEIEAELDQKHEEKIDLLVSAIYELALRSHSNHLAYDAARKRVKDLLLELIPRG